MLSWKSNTLFSPSKGIASIHQEVAYPGLRSPQCGCHCGSGDSLLGVELSCIIRCSTSHPLVVVVTGRWEGGHNHPHLRTTELIQQRLSLSCGLNSYDIGFHLIPSGLQHLTHRIFKSLRTMLLLPCQRAAISSLTPGSQKRRGDTSFGGGKGPAVKPRLAFSLQTSGLSHQSGGTTGMGFNANQRHFCFLLQSFAFKMWEVQEENTLKNDEK